MNLLGGVICPSVICQRTGPAFKWQDGDTWHEGDQLPTHIANALPVGEWGRCEVHRFMRMGDRSAA